MRASLPAAVSFGSRLRYALVIVLTLTSIVGLAGPVAASETETEAERVIRIATAQVGDRYAFSATGPDAFDCSGLVWFSFKEAGLRERIGDKRRTAAGLFRYFNKQGLADKQNPRPGDIVIWGDNKHAGIYIGDGYAVSALNKSLGIKVHKVSWINMRVKAYLHVNLER